MTDIRQLLADAADDVPPSRLSAQEMYAKGRARWRRRRAGLAAALAGTGVAVLMAGVFTFPGTRGPDWTGPPDAPSAYWAGGADRDHLFMIRNRCPNQYPEPSGPSCYELFASTDRGGTWESRGLLEHRPLPPEVIDNETLVVWYSAADPRARPDGRISTDGGRTWRQLTRDESPALTVPPGGAVSMLQSLLDIEVVDPAAGLVRPLASQPPVLVPRLQPAVGGIWVAGLDPDTRRPAVAVSRSGGLNWSVRELPATMPAPTDQAISDMYVPRVASWDGETVYATLAPDPLGQPAPTAAPEGQLTFPMYRSVDGGDTWQRVDPPWRGGWPNSPWATADGRLVMDLLDGDGRRLVYDGEGFELASPPGLPLQVSMDGQVASTADGVYVTDDGWTWREVWRSGVCHACMTGPTPGPTSGPTS